MLVADIGTGTGFLAERPSTQAHASWAWTSPKRCLPKCRTPGGTSFRSTQSGDTAGLPLGDGEVDAALGNMVLHHAEDPPAAILEMTRILKPGGRLVITDADTHTHEWLRTEQHDRWLGFDRADIGRWFRRPAWRT